MNRRIAYWHTELGQQLERIVSDAEEAEFVAEEVARQAKLNAPPTEAAYIKAMEAMFDAKAAERRYASRMTCTARAGYAGPFQAEATAFAIWMDTCNMAAYGVMAQVKGGQRAQPTIAELLALLPTLTWPAQVY